MTLVGGLPSEPKDSFVNISARDYIDGEIASLRREVETALRAHQRDHDAHATEHLVHADAHAREHNSSNLAILKAEEGLLLRFESHNRFREQLEQQAKTFATIPMVEQRAADVDRQLRQLHDSSLHAITREMFDDRLKGLSDRSETKTTALDDKVSEMKLSMERAIGRSQGISLAWGVVVILVSIGIGLLGLR